jgi:outer membrane protein TolC
MKRRSGRRSRARLALLLGAALAVTRVGAETLEDAWVLAETNDFGLAAARSDAEAAALDARAARGERRPVLMASGSFTQLQDAPAFRLGATALPEIFSHDNFGLAGLTVNMPLYTGGRIANQIAAADAGGRARTAAADGARKDLRLAVAESYVAVLRAERALAVAQSNVASLADFSRVVQSMFNREVVPRNDLLSAQVALANAEQVRLQAANGLELARAAYNRRIGQPLDRMFELAPVTLVTKPDLSSRTLAELEAKAQAARAEIAALEAQGQALGFAADAERSRRLPQVSLTGGYQYLENEVLDRQKFAMVGVDLKWAIFDGGQTRNRSDSLRLGQRATEQRLADVRSMLALETRQAWYSLQESRARIDVARDAVEQAEENLRIATQQYAAGLVNSTRVLEAEALRTMSSSNRENALLDVEVARVRLARAVGEL